MEILDRTDDRTDGRIDRIEALEALYAAPAPTSLAKESDRVLAPHAAMIAASPFCVLATRGPLGLDCSPRGDAPGFARVTDGGRAVLLPDRRGNNRIDSLRNIVTNGEAGLIFLVPGKGEALRVAGRGAVIADEALNTSFAVGGHAPVTVIELRVERVFHQCARAILRSGLWGDAPPRDDLPTAGQMTRAVAPDFDAEPYDAALAERQRATLY